jgi:haloacetate dehalogenase
MNSLLPSSTPQENPSRARVVPLQSVVLQVSTFRVSDRPKGIPMFEGFEAATFKTAEVDVRYRKGGAGPPLLLLHGHPQTSAMWHAIAPRLAVEFTVIAPDLRGYGGSGRPPAVADHETYSKRAMARDQIALMRHLGYERFMCAGHDRGGRVAYRLALDHPDAVTKLAILDILPTGEHFRRADMAFGLGYWHWFFAAQPYPLPENLIGANPDGYYFRGARDVFHPDAWAEYWSYLRDPATQHALCEDYRAGATYDFKLDEEDRGRKRIGCPTLILWGTNGPLEKLYDVLAVWRGWADDVHGHSIAAGHYFAEENPDATYAALSGFFR